MATRFTTSRADLYAFISNF